VIQLTTQLCPDTVRRGVGDINVFSFTPWSTVHLASKKVQFSIFSHVEHIRRIPVVSSYKLFTIICLLSQLRCVTHLWFLLSCNYQQNWISF